MRNLTWIAVAFLCCTTPATSAMAIPPPVEQYSANCQNPTYASDQLICSDEQLLSLDGKLVAILVFNPELTQRPDSAFFESQSAWLRRRSLCAMKDDHAACLRASYKDRVRVLQGVGQKIPGTVAVGRCKVRFHEDDAIFTAYNDQSLVVVDADRTVIGLVSTNEDASDWQPYVSAKKSRRMLELKTITGQVSNCHRPK